MEGQDGQAAGDRRRDRLNSTAHRVGIAVLAHRELPVAESIRAVMALAYAQEAQLLQIADFPPLARTAADIAADDDLYIGARMGVEIGGQIVGVLSFGPDPEAEQWCINTLVVHPAAQGQGTGRRLVEAALLHLGGTPCAVVTAAANAPALALYQTLGFRPYRHGVVGPDDLAMVKLRRGAQPAKATPSSG